MFSLGDLAPSGYAGTKLLNTLKTRLGTLDSTAEVLTQISL